jgi:peptide/nickel transport system substrate-binding protein
MLKSIKYFFKLTIAFINRFKFLLIISIVLGLLLFVVITNLVPKFSSKQKTVIGLTGRHHSENLPEFILEKISQGLTYVDEDGLVKPSIASYWEDQDNGKTWIFHLRNDVYWQDGQKLTSEDLNFNFKDVEIEKPNENTIIFKLKDPFSPFPSVLSKPVFKKGLLGTGEWEVQNLVIQANYVSELLLQNDNNQKVLYRFYPTTERTKTAFKLGKVEKIINLTEKTPFDEWQAVKLTEEINYDQVVTLFFNVKDEVLSDKSLRQALNYAIDKNEYNKRAISSISPKSWAYNPQVKNYEFDFEQAKETINELPNEVKQNLNIQLLSTPNLLPVAENISQNWQKIGVNSSVQITSFIPDEFQAYLTILDIPKDPDQYYLWHTTQTSTNISNYSDLRIDKLLEDARADTNQEERRANYIDFQRYLLEDLPAAFLYHPTSYTISR